MPPCAPPRSPWSAVTDDDGIPRETEPVERVEQRADVLVDVADAVEVVVLIDAQLRLRERPGLE